ncbi:MAG: bifunctional glutamate N-acetyltransferase/amino-acid acetyltransferase ArgJ [Candidatus Aerophobetes bacterium]|nr:bifunctional glutamate N-acetyltransferase/amino-acid acetyltransferase ArgJ [Candidatus Aerophobetes bacterium]
MEEIKGGITAPEGFKVSGVWCGIKKNKPDLALIYSKVPALARAMFTTNKVKAAPVQICIERIRQKRAQAIIVNSGNANSCTGKRGIRDAERIIKTASQKLRVKEKEVLMASTGIIGKPLPVLKIEEGIKEAKEALSFSGSRQAAEAILTTDRATKEIALETDISRRGKGKVKIGGMAKGSGMISPNLATMLCFITTDACISEDALEEALRNSVNKSFNKISVDGSMSTNDSVFILANGLARNRRIKTWRKKKKLRVDSEDFHRFCEALDYTCISLAKMIVRDGVGATKSIEIKVEGAPFPRDAHRIARSIANSNLVKTAVSGASPYWGRVMAAIGSAHTKLKIDRVDVYFDDIKVVGEGATTGSDEEKLREILKKDEIIIRVQLNQGNCKTTFWGCDLSEKYVRINKRYL